MYEDDMLIAAQFPADKNRKTNAKKSSKCIHKCRTNLITFQQFYARKNLSQ